MPGPDRTATGPLPPTGPVSHDDDGSSVRPDSADEMLPEHDDYRPGGGIELAAASLAGGAAPVSVVAPMARGRRQPRGVIFWAAVVWLVVVIFGAVTASVLPLPDPNEIDIRAKLAGPFTEGHLLGTDGLGRDLLSRLASGARVSLTISFVSVAIGMVLGGTLGMMVGYFRGVFESVVMWAMNVLLAFPALIFLLGLVAFVGQSMVAIIAAIAFFSIPIYARVARATTLAVSQREFVVASRAMGARSGRILFREILPNVLLPVGAFALVALGVVIVAEGTLAFLGLSVEPPAATWGGMIAEGRRHIFETVNAALVPSVVMFLTVLALNFVGDSVRGRFDVRESNL